MNKSFFIKCLCVFSLVMTISLDASAATTCKAGYYLKNNKCVICPAGQISAKGAYKSCTTCPAGQYEKNHKVCVTCPDGYYCRAGKRRACSTKEYCPAGSNKPQICPPNTTCQRGIIKKCPKGYKLYKNACVCNGYESSKGCVSQCSEKTGVPYVLNDGKTSKCVTEKECLNMGYALDKNSGSCIKCPEGYKIQDGQCVEPQPVCPSDQELNKEGKCVCKSGLPKKPDGVCLTSWEEVKKISCKEGKFNIIAEGWGMGVGDIPYAEFYDSICHECPKNATCDGIKILCNIGYKKEGSKCVADKTELGECRVVNNNGEIENKVDGSQCGGDSGYCKQGECVNCGYQQYYNPNTQSCECTNGMVLQNGKCVEPEPVCPPDKPFLKRYYSTMECVECLVDYNYGKDGECPTTIEPVCQDNICQKCPDNMRYSQELSQCVLSCEEGYYEKGNTCVCDSYTVNECQICNDKHKIENKVDGSQCGGDSGYCKQGKCVNCGYQQYYNPNTQSCEYQGDVEPEPIVWCKQNYTISNKSDSCPIDRPICKNSKCAKCTTDADCLFDIDNGIHHQGARCDSNGMCIWAENIGCVTSSADPDSIMVVDPKTLECVCQDGKVLQNGKCVSLGAAIGPCPQNAICQNGKIIKCQENFVLQNDKCVRPSGGVNGGVYISHLDGAVVYQTGDNDYPVDAVCPANSTCVWSAKCAGGYSKVNGSCTKDVALPGGQVGPSSGTSTSPPTGTPQQSDGIMERAEISSAPICDKGQYTNNRGNCVTCPAGYYCPDPAGTPKACPVKTYNPKTGQTSKGACLTCSYATQSGTSTCTVPTRHK